MSCICIVDDKICIVTGDSMAHPIDGSPNIRVEIDTDKIIKAHYEENTTMIRKYVPDGMLHKYCLIYGQIVVGSYDSWKDVKNAIKSSYRDLEMRLWCPIKKIDI